MYRLQPWRFFRLGLWATLAILIAGAVIEGAFWWRADRLNLQIASPFALRIDEASAPELVFAKAYSEAQRGRPAEAIRLYGTLLERGDHAFRERVRYNLGTLYLRQAAELWNAKGVLEYVRINTLLISAKAHLQEALRLDPYHWAARYNLEYAYRITPPPKERPKQDFQGSKGSVFATLPSLPGGGP
jgi:mxaK protein